MFTLFEPNRQRLPIKVWLEASDQLEAVCLEQAVNLSNLPFAHQWIALMPDTHSGYGMPIGGVLASEGVVIPNAVGVDIGCGVVFEQTSLPVAALTGGPFGKGVVETIVSEILRRIPTGFSHHKQKQTCTAAEHFSKKLTTCQKRSFEYPLMKELENACFQMGTLGGGNHFIELQEDDEGLLCLMVHSGSRNVGHTLCTHFNKLAKELNKRKETAVPAKWDLAYLSAQSPEGEAYIRWMQFALEFAFENRERMMDIVREIVQKTATRYKVPGEIQVLAHHHCHHNYASLEYHGGKNVWIHRKGAIRVREGEIGIIPGAMGGWSYLVRGRGNPESFNSCSHGAGRQMSRQAAKKQFSVQETLKDLAVQGVVIGKAKQADIGEESRFAYKDIEFVIRNELDLIDPVKRMKTVAVVKG